MPGAPQHSCTRAGWCSGSGPTARLCHSQARQLREGRITALCLGSLICNIRAMVVVSARAPCRNSGRSRYFEQKVINTRAWVLVGWWGWGGVRWLRLERSCSPARAAKAGGHVGPLLASRSRHRGTAVTGSSRASLRPRVGLHPGHGGKKKLTSAGPCLPEGTAGLQKGGPGSLPPSRSTRGSQTGPGGPDHPGRRQGSCLWLSACREQEGGGQVLGTRQPGTVTA